MAMCNWQRCAISRSGPRAASSKRPRACFKLRAWNSFMAASKSLSCFCPLEIGAGATAAGSDVFTAVDGCGFVMRLSEDLVTLVFFSGISTGDAPAQQRLAFYTRVQDAHATVRLRSF